MAKTKKEDKEDMSDGSIAVNDAWTGMLAISLLALVVAAGFLLYDYLQMSGNPQLYNFTTTPPKAPPKVNPPPKPEENKDKDKDKDVEKEKDKDKDMEKDKDKEKDKDAEKDKEKDKAALPVHRFEFAQLRAVKDESFSAIHRPTPAILQRRK